MRKTQDEYDFVSLGRRIQMRRKELGLTQEQLAEKVDCSLTHVCRIESGHRPSLIALIRLSTFLGFSLDEITDLHPAQNPYIQEASTLFRNHSAKKQKYALSMLRHIFDLLDQFENDDKYPCKKNSAKNSSGIYASSDTSVLYSKELWTDTWN